MGKIDYTKILRERITKLRMKKDVSEYQMSLDLGLSKGYINNISTGKVLPSMNSFFDICDYFEISPYDFFNISDPVPMETLEMINLFSTFDEEDKNYYLNQFRRLNEYYLRHKS